MPRRRLVLPAVVTLGLTLLPACSRNVPAPVKGTLDGVRADARSVALAAAKACEAQVRMGRYTASATACGINKLPGEEVVPGVPSAARGTPLDANADVANVLSSCMLPMAQHGRAAESCVMGLDALRPAPTDLVSGRTREKTTESNCKASPTDCEEVVVPSQYAPGTETADLRIVKPVAGGPPGASVEVTIVLARK